MSTDHEYTPLFSSHHKQQQTRRCPFSYRFQFIHSKGALLVLFWDLMIAISQNMLVILAEQVSLFADNGILILTILDQVYLLAGIISDTCVKRYHMIVTGSYLMFTFVVLTSLSLVANYYFSHSLIIYTSFGLYVMAMLTSISVRVSLIPFNIDQLIGSSSDELSAVIHWHTVGPMIVNFGNAAIGMILLEDRVKNRIICLLSVLCITAALVGHTLFKHWLDTTPQTTTNPFKLIARVLHYARKHKYPENRSALTYWEEVAPSRLDLGKEKYGGPFTEEEVEDVKTAFRLIPLFICIIADSFLSTAVYFGKTYGCSAQMGELTQSAVFLLLIFFYQFLIFPCFYKCIPSMLKRIGAGLVLVVLINIIYTIMALIKNVLGHRNNCLVSLNQVTSNMADKWATGTSFLDGFVRYFFFVTFLEFILAQSPKGMRGTLLGLWFSLINLRAVFDAIVFLPFHYFMSSVPLGRGFYFYLAETI